MLRWHKQNSFLRICEVVPLPPPGGPGATESGKFAHYFGSGRQRVVGGVGEAVSLFGDVVDVGVCVGFAARAIDPG